MFTKQKIILDIINNIKDEDDKQAIYSKVNFLIKNEIDNCMTAISDKLLYYTKYSTKLINPNESALPDVIKSHLIEIEKLNDLNEKILDKLKITTITS